MPGLTSVGGIISLMYEREPKLKVFAITKLSELVNNFWPEIANVVDKIEEIYEDISFSHRKEAALLAAQVYYHLGELDDALHYALLAEEKFDVEGTNLFVTTIKGWAMDSYISKRQQSVNVSIDPALQALGDRMLNQCLQDHEFRQAIGLALEARRLDVVRAAINQCTDKASILTYTYDLSMKYIPIRTFRDDVLAELAQAYEEYASEEYFNRLQCLVSVGHVEKVSAILLDLLSKDRLMAYQLCFHLEQMASQSTLQAIIQSMNSTENSEENSEATAPALTELERVKDILNGQVSRPLLVEFMGRNNKSDVLLLNRTKKDISAASAMLENALVLSYGIMSTGTTSDAFLRDNQAFLSRFTNWAKFSAVASLGVIHKSHSAAAQKVLEPYLPTDGGQNNEYECGGGLYALGLIFANNGASQLDYLVQQLKTANNETIQHGAALGLGLAAMGLARSDVHDELRNVLVTDNAVAGEASGIALGLNMLGAMDHEALELMISYGTETQHEKIVRGLAIGIALTLYGRQEQANSYIDRLINDKDPTLRSSGCHAMAMAYAGTNNNDVIRRLLHVAVTNANDDVRRAAVIALGFVLIRTPDQVPSVVALLCESFNPHVRAGCCMALGIACAATGNKEAIDLVEPMIKDSVRYVRQSALVSMALILLQQPNSHSKISSFRKLLPTVISNRHEVLMVRFGAILAQGILEAGGRNVSVQACRDHGHMDAPTIVGLLIFTQFWFWYPLSHFLSLALTPTALICLNGDLKMPKIEIKSNAKPSQFAYPPATEPPKEKSKEKVATAILSISNRKTSRRKLGSLSDMDTRADEEPVAENQQKEKDEKLEVKEPEPGFEMLQNPCRVVKDQIPLLSIPSESRYVPVAPIRGGIVVLRDKSPDSEEQLIDVSSKGTGPPTQEVSEVPPPPPFEFKPENEDES